MVSLQSCVWVCLRLNPETEGSEGETRNREIHEIERCEGREWRREQNHSAGSAVVVTADGCKCVVRLCVRESLKGRNEKRPELFSSSSSLCATRSKNERGMGMCCGYGVSVCLSPGELCVFSVAVFVFTQEKEREIEEKLRTRDREGRENQKERDKRCKGVSCVLCSMCVCVGADRKNEKKEMRVRYVCVYRVYVFICVWGTGVVSNQEEDGERKRTRSGDEGKSERELRLSLAATVKNQRMKKQKRDGAYVSACERVRALAGKSQIEEFRTGFDWLLVGRSSYELEIKSNGGLESNEGENMRGCSSPENRNQEKEN